MTKRNGKTPTPDPRRSRVVEGPMAMPEIAHMLDVLTGAQQALDELMTSAKKDKDPSVIRLCVSEAENISATATRLAQSMTAWEAENPGQVRKNASPRQRDTELDDMADRLLTLLRSVGWREELLARHAALLDDGVFREGDYHYHSGQIATPTGDTLIIEDWLEVLDLYRGLTCGERADMEQMKRDKNG